MQGCVLPVQLSVVPDGAPLALDVLFLAMSAYAAGKTPASAAFTRAELGPMEAFDGFSGALSCYNSAVNAGAFDGRVEHVVIDCAGLVQTFATQAFSSVVQALSLGARYIELGESVVSSDHRAALAVDGIPPITAAAGFEPNFGGAPMMIHALSGDGRWAYGPGTDPAFPADACELVPPDFLYVGRGDGTGTPRKTAGGQRFNHLVVSADPDGGRLLVKDYCDGVLQTVYLGIIDPTTGEVALALIDDRPFVMHYLDQSVTYRWTHNGVVQHQDTRFDDRFEEATSTVTLIDPVTLDRTQVWEEVHDGNREYLWMSGLSHVICDYNGRATWRLGRVALQSVPAALCAVSISPDGAWMASETRTDLHVARLRIFGSRHIRPGGGWQTPWWSPDSRLLALITRDDNGNTELRIAEPQRMLLRQHLSSRSQEFLFVGPWQRSGDAVFINGTAFSGDGSVPIYSGRMALQRNN